MHADQCGFLRQSAFICVPKGFLHSPLVFLLWHHASSLHFQPQRNREYRKNKNLCGEHFRQKILPGFMMLWGSRACLMARMAPRLASPNCAGMYLALR